MSEPWQRFLRMPAQTNADKAPHWVATMEERSGELLLTIPEVGGQVDASLALGQDGWFQKWLEKRAGVQNTWTTVWKIESRELAQTLLDELVRDFGAEPLDAKQYGRAYGELYNAVWDRVLKR